MRLRTYEISKMLPIISGAYQQQNETNKINLIVFLCCVAFNIILLVVLFQLFKQMRN
jgi:hypothetical protein